MIVTVVNHWSAVLSYHRGVEILLIHLLGLYVMKSARINTLQGGFPVYVYWGSQPYYYQIEVWEIWAPNWFYCNSQEFVQIARNLGYNGELMSQSKVKCIRIDLVMLNPTNMVFKIPYMEPNPMSAEGPKLNFSCVLQRWAGGFQILLELNKVMIMIGLASADGISWWWLIIISYGRLRVPTILLKCLYETGSYLASLSEHGIVFPFSYGSLSKLVLHPLS